MKKKLLIFGITLILLTVGLSGFRIDNKSKKLWAYLK